MKRFSLLMAGLCLAGTAFAAPKISARGVRSIAPVKESTIARGSVFLVLGSDLGPAETVKGEVPYPTDLNGLTVAVTTRTARRPIKRISSKPRLRG